MSPDPAVQLVLRGSLALLFAAAARHKLRDPAGFRAALAGYALLPARVVAPAARLLAVLELAAALLLCAPGTRAAGAVLAAALLLLYGAAIGANLLRGRIGIDCGCAGPVARRLGADLLLRNALLLAAACVCALEPSLRGLVPYDGLTVGAGVAALALVHVAAETALANHHALRAGGSPA